MAHSGGAWRTQEAGLGLNTSQTAHEANDPIRCTSIVKEKRASFAKNSLFRWIVWWTGGKGAFEMRHSFLYFFSLARNFLVHFRTVYASPQKLAWPLYSITRTIPASHEVSLHCTNSQPPSVLGLYQLRHTAKGWLRVLLLAISLPGTGSLSMFFTSAIHFSPHFFLARFIWRKTSSSCFLPRCGRGTRCCCGARLTRGRRFISVGECTTIVRVTALLPRALAVHSTYAAAARKLPVRPTRAATVRNTSRARRNCAQYIQSTLQLCAIHPEHAATVRNTSRARRNCAQYIQSTPQLCAIHPEHAATVRNTSRARRNCAQYIQSTPQLCAIHPEHAATVRNTSRARRNCAQYIQSTLQLCAIHPEYAATVRNTSRARCNCA